VQSLKYISTFSLSRIISDTHMSILVCSANFSFTLYTVITFKALGSKLWQ